MRLPYFDNNGHLCIPLDAPEDYRWWQAAKNGRYDRPFPDCQDDIKLVEAAFERANEVANGGGEK